MSTGVYTKVILVRDVWTFSTGDVCYLDNGGRAWNSTLSDYEYVNSSDYVPFAEHTAEVTGGSTAISESTVTGGPSKYYDLPFKDWVTINDQAEYFAEHQWGKFGIHMKELLKVTSRWGIKEGTSQEYDARKLVYYGFRILRMIIGNEKARKYLEELLDNEQFKNPTNKD